MDTGWCGANRCRWRGDSDPRPRWCSTPSRNTRPATGHRVAAGIPTARRSCARAVHSPPARCRESARPRAARAGSGRGAGCRGRVRSWHWKRWPTGDRSHWSQSRAAAPSSRIRAQSTRRRDGRATLGRSRPSPSRRSPRWFRRSRARRAFPTRDWRPREQTADFPGWQATSPSRIDPSAARFPRTARAEVQASLLPRDS